ncbi:PulJ/GspJ family protein [Massilia horti]|uniref:Type II secretion system protein n=1 Tax=Massilia horti TaxID=2562153 RepID=A0A4Y9SW83_9BURK|nr:type II secretion system protein [Massilia horti]TFW30984.1 type II secretion system protein [Massilia horti]
MKPQPKRRALGGFTLAEMIIAIILLGVLGTIVAVFIRAPVKNYADAVGRAELTDQADLALRRMARELRLALPNSIRVNADGSAVEFLITRSGGRYLAAEDGIPDAPALDFLDPGKREFTVLGALGSFSGTSVGDYVVVYNLGSGMAPADAWQGLQGDTNIAKIKAISQRAVPEIDPDTSHTFPVLTLERNPFAQQSTPMPSPTQRFQVVTGPVSYYCAQQPDGTLTLWRSSGYDISPTQNVPPAGAVPAPLATRLASCGHLFDYGSAATQRSSLVILSLELKARNEHEPSIRLVHQVHVDNTP